MSVGQIQHQELFDEDEEDDNIAAAAADDDAVVNNADDMKVHSNDIQTVSSTLCCSNMFRDVLTMVLLTAVNLLNYMDRFSVAGEFS